MSKAKPSLNALGTGSGKAIAKVIMGLTSAAIYVVLGAIKTTIALLVAAAILVHRANDLARHPVEALNKYLGGLWVAGLFAAGGASATMALVGYSSVPALAADPGIILEHIAEAIPAPTTTPAPAKPKPTDISSGELDAFMASIGAQESKGDYTIRNADSGAYGKYQIMPRYWPGWAKEAGLPSNAPMTAQNQERVARHKMQAYYAKFHNWHAVAVAWYAGPKAVGRNGNAKQGKYPSINAYADSVVARMRAK